MDRADIEALAELLGSGKTGSDQNVLISCPMAARSHKNGTDAHPSFSVKVVDDGPSPAHCHACGVGGFLVQVLEEAEKDIGGFGPALAFAREHDRSGVEGAMARVRRSDAPAAIETAAASGLGLDADLDRYVARCYRAGVPRYLVERRGIVRADVLKWKIGFDLDLAAPKRATFPCWDEHKRIVGVSRRTVVDEEPRFLDTPGAWKGAVFYGEHLIDTTLGTVVLVEGVLGTIFAARELPNVLGLLGAHVDIGNERLAKLKRWGVRTIVLMLDSDEAGRRAAFGWVDKKGKKQLGLRDLLRRSFIVKVAELPSGDEDRKDPADFPGSVVRDAYNRASYLTSRRR